MLLASSYSLNSLTFKVDLEYPNEQQLLISRRRVSEMKQEALATVATVGWYDDVVRTRPRAGNK